MNRQSKLVPTRHAIDRYVERFAPNASPEQARHTLTVLASRARRLKVQVSRK